MANLDRMVEVLIEPSQYLSNMLGYPYYIKREYTMRRLLEMGIITQADITEMEAKAEGIRKHIPVTRESVR